MVVFGAGASYDSLAREPPHLRMFHGAEWRPPLANQLFESRWGPYIQQFPQAHAIIPDLELPNIDVEARLEQFQKEATEHPRRLVQLTAIRYYLQSMLSDCIRNWESVTKGVTNYKALLGQIDHRVRGEKLLVTFNYDTMLEEALPSTVGVKIRGLSDYVKSDYKVIKLHGSIDWWHRVNAPTFVMSETLQQLRNGVIDNGAQIRVDGEFEFIRGDPRPMMDKPFIPALSIPVALKSDLECPQSQVSALVEALPNVDRVLVIGWHGNEEQFLHTIGPMIGRKPLRLMVVSRNKESADLVFQKIQSVSGAETGDTSLTIEGGFSKAILGHEIDEFLKQSS